MGMTMTQKILAAHAGLDNVVAGQLINAKLDIVLGNDITTPVAVNEFKKAGFTSVFDKDKVKIIDYKYSALTAESLKNKYKKQLDLYAFAVKKVFGVERIEKSIVSLLSGEVINID